MIEVDKGHTFYLEVFDYPGSTLATLRFMKRKGEMYPGNTDAYPGTNSQEVIRALIARSKYVNNQIHHEANKIVLDCLRTALYWLESRAAERHGTTLLCAVDEIENLPVGRNGHLLIGAGKE